MRWSGGIRKVPGSRGSGRDVEGHFGGLWRCGELSSVNVESCWSWSGETWLWW